MKNITLPQLDAYRQTCIDRIKVAIDDFKKDTGILDASISLNPYSEDGSVCHSPTISIRL